MPTLKSLVVRAATLPPAGQIIGRYYRDRIPSGGCVIRTDSPHVASVVKARVRMGFYERTELRMLRRHLRSDLDGVELGSSIGMISSHIARMLDPGRRLLCVEANPHLTPLIEANLRHNAPECAWKVVNSAIDYDDTRDHVDFALAADSATSRVEQEFGRRPGETVRVPTLQLHRLLRDEGIGDYALFADIEGAEVDLLQHDDDALSGCQQLILEMHGTRFSGKPFGTDDIERLIETRHGLRKVDRHHDVAVFERPPA